MDHSWLGFEGTKIFFIIEASISDSIRLCIAIMCRTASIILCLLICVNCSLQFVTLRRHNYNDVVHRFFNRSVNCIYSMYEQIAYWLQIRTCIVPFLPGLCTSFSLPWIVSTLYSLSSHSLLRYFEVHSFILPLDHPVFSYSSVVVRIAELLIVGTPKPIVLQNLVSFCFQMISLLYHVFWLYSL